ncbi:SspB family protein [Maritalea mediterranea]|uniref:SspB family protein n=1 Tax=Maritalea mediterranea TaxID=2909667 RepID=A0ABS9E9L8_9HYPH|nr:SspB family protein [Maritalea mediterranea]MCF4098902.1 SspB family protein [Maritalea mediterranea]
MAEDLIRYDILAQEALRGVVRKVLNEVAKTGLPGEHHFFISFVTTAPGVRISQRLLEQYKNEMTIVLQNQYWDLKTTETGFEVGLSFDGQPEILVVPYSAIKGFFDPSVQFGLQFDVTDENGESQEDLEDIPSSTLAADNGDTPEKAEKDAEADTAKSDEEEGENVVSLDSFRKKP